MSNAEEWKPIVGYEGIYEISTSWQVASLPRTGRRYRMILKQIMRQDGCPCVHLSIHGKVTTRKVANLVANAFLPARLPTDTVVRHLNDNPADNRVENLARGTYSDNQRDAIRNGKHKPPPMHAGEECHLAKLNESQVREIRRLYATGNFTQRKLALQYGVTAQTICKIVRRKIWKHI